MRDAESRLAAMKCDPNPTEIITISDPVRELAALRSELAEERRRTWEAWEQWATATQVAFNFIDASFEEADEIAALRSEIAAMREVVEAARAYCAHWRGFLVVKDETELGHDPEGFALFERLMRVTRSEGAGR